MLYACTVLFDVTPLRDKGRLVLKWHRAVIRAHVTIDEDRDPEVHRVVRVARAESTVPDRYIPLLYDAVVLSIRSDCITITGFERAIESPLRASVGTHYQQTWLVQPTWVRTPEFDERFDQRERDVLEIRRGAWESLRRVTELERKIAAGESLAGPDHLRKRRRR